MGKADSTKGGGSVRKFERTRQAKWDAGNIHTASTRLTARQMERFKTQCLLSGQTPYRVLQLLILGWVNGMEADREKRVRQELERFRPRHEKDA